MGLKPQTDVVDATVVEEFIGTAYDNVLLVANSIADVNIVAPNIADVNTVATLEADGDLALVIAAPAITEANKVAALASEDAAALSEAATAADLVLTNADVVLTHADVVLTTADALATAADVVITNADVVTTTADRLQVALDAAQVASDLVSVAAIFDSFDDTYLGPKAIDPTLDNDGNPLVAGQVYWNTTDSEVRFYNGAAWEQPEASAAASAAAALASEQAAAASYDLFDDRFLGSKASDPTLDNDGNALSEGALYWNSTSKAMRVYAGTGWAGVIGSSTAGMFEYTATAGQTTFSGLDDNGTTLAYTLGFMFISINGRILDTSDYTASDTTSVILGVGANAGDTLFILAFGTFDIANTYTQAQTDAAFIPNTDIGVTVQAYSATNALLTDVRSGNRIYNGLCLVNQKSVVLDAAAVAATNNQYPIDQHKTTLSGVTGTHQWLSTSQPTGLTGYSLKYAATSTASGQIGSRQIIERYADYAGKTVTYSRYVKSNSADARVVVDDGVTVTAGTAHTGGGAWELLTVTVAAGATPTELTCYAVIASAALANVSITSGDYIEFAGARLDLGSYRLSGDREYGEELALCQRYYQSMANVFARSAETATGLGIYIPHPVPFSATPTLGGINFGPVGTNSSDRYGIKLQGTGDAGIGFDATGYATSEL